MFAAVLQPPLFGGLSSALPSTMLASPCRPVKPSPLSSSPVCVTSPTREPLPSSAMQCSSPIRPFSPPARRFLSHQDTQSSPVQPSSSAASEPASAWFTAPAPNQNPFSRFAARPVKPVPRVAQNRDATRQTRRSLFLRDVRQRASDRSWDRRNCEQELQKLEWWSLERQIRQTREADATSMLTEHDFDDAAEWMQPWLASQDAVDDDSMDDDDNDPDAHLADLLVQEDEAEISAWIASMGAAEPGTAQSTSLQPPSSRPRSVDYSDDDDYDALFSELLAQPSQSADAEDMEMA